MAVIGRSQTVSRHPSRIFNCDHSGISGVRSRCPPDRIPGDEGGEETNRPTRSPAEAPLPPVTETDIIMR